MWDETLIESKGRRAGKRSWLTAALSVSFHFAVVAVIIAASYWYLEAVEPQMPRQPFVQPLPLPQPDTVPVILRRGTPQGNDRPARSTQPAVPQPQVTQDQIDPHQDLDLDGTPPSIPFNLADAGPDGTGPRGDPEGKTDFGSDLGTPNGGDGDVITIKAGVVEPVLVYKVEPEYPEIARRAHIQGYVVLKAIITRSGDVEVREVRNSVHPILDREAIRAVNQWKYRPATVNGRPVNVWFQVTVSFKLR